MRLPAKIKTASLAALLLTGCGGAGEGDKPACVLCGKMNDVRGALSSLSGNQAQMAGWAVVALEHDSSIARVGDVDNAGLFGLSHLRTDVPQTIVLLSPDYIVQSVLSIPGAIDKTIRQYVTIGTPNLPKLIAKGPIVTLENLNGLGVTRDLASDVDGDGIPDGSVSLGAKGLSLTQGAGSLDIDQDGIPNERDPDIDGDGIVNAIDDDEDGDGIMNVFDGDANGNLVNDASEVNGNLYFKEGVEFVAVQFAMKPKDDGSGLETSLKFVTKVRPEITPNAVQVRGAPTLLNGSNFVAKDSTGADTAVAWNRLLGDDGVSEDGTAGDRLFAKKVILDAAKTPRAHEMVFFQLVFGTPDAPWYIEFPFTFPDVKPATVTAQYESNTKTVLLVGNPFGTIQDFVWTINVFNDADKVVWTSQPVPGTTRQFAIADNVMEAGVSYTYAVVAQSIDKVPGYPAYTIQSQKYNLK